MTDSVVAADVVVVGAGLAGLVATREALAAGRRVVLLDQESEANLGGQAHWSFGGLFLIDTPEQRRLGIRDSLDLAWRDWQGSAGFDRREDHWPRQWARAYVEFAAGEKRAWLHELGHRLFPVVGWAERGDGTATGHGNSVPRFHVTWGTGPGLLEPFVADILQAHAERRLDLRFRHRVDALDVTDGVVTGVCGAVLAGDAAPRGVATNRDVVGEFAVQAGAVVITSGGIGANHDLVRAAWPQRLGTPPNHLISGVPAHVDGRLLGIAQQGGASLINADRMWHYVEGVHNWNSIWPGHGIRILPGPSSLWLDSRGDRLPPPFFPGFDTLGTLAYLRRGGHEWSWFVANQSIVGREYTLSGSEQNPDLTDRDVRGVLSRAGSALAPAVADFVRHGADWVTATDVETLVARMNALTPEPLLDAHSVAEQIAARDAQLGNRYGKDAQLAAIRAARASRGDRLVRVAAPGRLLDPKAGPLIAVRLSVLTRKTLGGLETDLDARVLRPGGAVLPGLYAAGEVAGFGGGGMHGYRSLEGTFLGGCLFSGRVAGRAAARDSA